MGPRRCVRLIVVGLLLCVPARASAEWQAKPFVGFSFNGTTTFVDSDVEVPNNHFLFGVTVLAIGEVLGVEADLGFVPGLFTGGHLVTDSGVTTVTGNVVVALPRRMARYSLRPYAVVGGGLMRVNITYGPNGVLPNVGSNLAVIDIGGGVTGFFTDRVGINWDVRRFGSEGGRDRMQATSIGAEQLSFWRATTAVVVRF